MASGPGTNYFSKLNDLVNIALTEGTNWATYAECIGNPNVVATTAGIFVTGCIMRRKDITTGPNLFANTGTLAVPSWSYIGGLIGSTSGVTSNPPPGLTNETWFGEGAGQGATTDYTTFIGINAGFGANNAGYSTFIGLNAGSGATDAQEAVFIGNNAGLNSFNSVQSVMIGEDAGNSVDNGNYSTFIGTAAAFQATNALNSTFIGYRSGYTSTDAQQSVFIGYESGYNAPTASDSIFIGYNSGLNDTVNNTIGGGTSILIGKNTSTGGFKNSIAIGEGATNTKTNQVLFPSTITNFHLPLVSFANDAAAGVGGLVAGDWYYNTTTPAVDIKQ